MHTVRIILLLTLALAVLSGCPQRRAASPANAGKSTGATKVPPSPYSGLPVRLDLPPGADTHGVDLASAPLQQRTGNSRTWAVPFTYDGGFSTVAQMLEAQLRDKQYERIVGPNTDHDPGFSPEQPTKPATAYAVKTWIAGDKKTVVFLRYNYHRAEPGAAEQQDYRLEVLELDQPQPVKPPNKAVAIP